MNVIVQPETTTALMFHGFTGAPSDVEPIIQTLSSYGWNCHAPLLPGHENEYAAIGRTSWTEWLDCAVEEAEICKRKYGSFSVVGFSMGCYLAAYIANRYPVERVVLLNAPVILLSPTRFFSFVWEKVRARDFAQFRRAAKIPHCALLEFMKMASKLRHEFRGIRQPTLICQSERDQVVHPRSASYLDRIIPGQTHVVMFPLSKHVICWDVEAEEVVRVVERFLVSGLPPGHAEMMNGEN